MTAAVPGPRFRDQLAAWLREHTGSPDGDSWDEWPLHLERTAAHLAAHVQAEVQAATNQRAAEELREIILDAQIVGEVMHERGPIRVPITYLEERAAALAQSAPEDR